MPTSNTPPTSPWSPKLEPAIVRPRPVQGPTAPTPETPFGTPPVQQPVRTWASDADPSNLNPNA